MESMSLCIYCTEIRKDSIKKRADKDYYFKENFNNSSTALEFSYPSIISQSDSFMVGFKRSVSC